MTGEDSVQIDSIKTLIKNRARYTSNDLAADYIKQRLKKYNLQVFDQQYSWDGRNIIGAQKGKRYSEKIYIICAHYDAVDYYCADDNASGVATVLEAARILSKYQFEYSLVYAFWDQEETGGHGSKHFAFMASESEVDILGVINVDMIGWDGNHDGLFDIHSNDVANSDSLAEMLVKMNLIYNLPLDPIVYHNSRLSSDQRSFWDNGYPAVMIIEAYYGRDFNPYYHSERDRIDKFDLNYFYSLSILSIAAISNLARVVPGELSN